MDSYWRVNRTLLQKLTDTHYQIPEAETIAIASRAAFAARFRTVDDLNRVFYPQVDTIAQVKAPDGVQLFFERLSVDERTGKAKKHIGVDAIRRLVSALEVSHATTAFLVVNGPVYHKAQELLTSISGQYRVVVFSEDELSFNVTRHLRVPKHELLSSIEIANFLEATKLKRSQMPVLYHTDPVAKYLDARPGEIMRVTNPSPTVGFFTRHLAVVQGH